MFVLVMTQRSTNAWAALLPALARLDLECVKLPASGLREARAGCPRLTTLSLESADFGAVEGGVGSIVCSLNKVNEEW